MRKIIHTMLCLVGLISGSLNLQAQDFLLQGCYWDCPESNSIEIDEASLKFWTSKIKSQAAELGHNGFSYIWLPATKTSDGDITNLISDLDHLGIQTITDLQLSIEQDSSANLPDFTADWLTQANNLGVQAYQVGQNKSLKANQLGALLNGLYDQDKAPALFVTAAPEEEDLSSGANWINNIVKAMTEEASRLISPRVQDNLLREALRQACSTSDYDIRNIFQNSLRDATALSGFNVITFVNSPNHRNQNEIDNDADDLIDKPLLAYAYTLTNNQIGLPSVFYADYYGKESEADLYLDKLPLKEGIDQLMKTHKQYIHNSTSVEYLNTFNSERASHYLSEKVQANNVLIYQIDGSNTIAGLSNNGGKDVIVAINFAQDTLKVLQEINMSNIESGDHFTDIIGLSNISKTDVAFNTEHHIPNAVYLELPPLSYSAWVQGNERLVVAEFIEFAAEAYDDYVELSWDIPSEKDLKGYEIQKSINSGIFQQIGWIDADHYTEEGASYLFIDEDNLHNGSLHYRIKLVDNEGSIEYSSSEEISYFKRQLKFELQESVNAGVKTIKVESNIEDTAELAVFNSEGARVLHENHHINKGTTQKEVNLQDLPSGVYILNYSTPSKQSWTERILKL